VNNPGYALPTMRTFIVTFVCTLALAVVWPGAQAQQAPPAELGVMSFNIRYGTANDGENRWPLRRDLLFDVVRQVDADVVGLQEALHSQIVEITTAVPGYSVIGVGRDDGHTRGEYAAILFRHDRFHVAESGTFWFSDTPSIVASKSWGNTITRICTWARLIDRQGQPFWVFNVHLDHQSQPSRERSTALLAERIRARVPATEPVVVTGDFNVGEANPCFGRCCPWPMARRCWWTPSACAIRRRQRSAPSRALIRRASPATRSTMCSSRLASTCVMRRSSGRGAMAGCRRITSL